MRLNNIPQKLVVIALVIVNTFVLQAQDKREYIHTNNARESIQIAQGFINDGKYRKAKRQLKHTIKLKEDFAVAHRELGRVYLELQEYENAIESLESSFTYNSKLSRAAYFECGESYFYLSNLSQALYYYNEYSSRKETHYTNKKKEIGLEKEYDIKLDKRVGNIQFISEAKATGFSVEVKNLGDGVNSNDNEYLPAILSNGQRIVFTRDKKGRNENILTAVQDTTGKWVGRRALDNKVNTHANEGMAKFATNGKKFFFTGCQRPDTNGGCDIYEAEMNVFGEVVNVQHVEGVNTRKWDSQPCTTCNMDAMYFSSNRPGGFGGTDIYVSYRQKNGIWGEPTNLGKSINSEGDEEAPFIATDGKTLYFTSTGHAGFGDGDLFYSELNGMQWSEAKNMGHPFNSPAKELGFFLLGDGKTAYFASARAGGSGGLDLYSVELPEVLRPIPMNHIQGYIVDDETGKPIETPFVIRRIGERYNYASDEGGEFFTCLKQDKAYTFHVEVEGYKEFMTATYLPKTDNADVTEVVIRLVKENKPHAVKEETIASNPNKAAPSPPSRKRKIVKRVFFYFDVNSADLNEQAMSKLQDLVNTIKFDDKWNIEIVGFADSSGDASYNKMLSENRAKTVADYLRVSGISIDKVRQEGKGAIQGQSEQEKKKSRRVEVILRGVLD